MCTEGPAGLASACCCVGGLNPDGTEEESVAEILQASGTSEQGGPGVEDGWDDLVWHCCSCGGAI